MKDMLVLDYRIFNDEKVIATYGMTNMQNMKCSNK